MIDQLQIDAATSKIITVLTSRSAAKNKPNIDNSDDVDTASSAVSI
jgi:hypothetical protein